MDPMNRLPTRLFTLSWVLGWKDLHLVVVAVGLSATHLQCAAGRAVPRTLRCAAPHADPAGPRSKGYVLPTL